MALGKVGACVLVAVCLFASTDALIFDEEQTMTDDDYSPATDSAAMQLDKAMNELDVLKQMLDSRSKGQCNCAGLACQCCKELEIPKLRFHKKGCLILTFRPRTKTVIVAMKVLNNKVFEQEFPVSKPTSPCFKVSKAMACLQFYDWREDSNTVTGCGKITVRLFGLTLLKLELGCFKIKLNDQLADIRMADAETVFDTLEDYDM